MVLRAVFLVLVTASPVVAFQRETTADVPCVEAPDVNCPHNGTPLSWRQQPVLFLTNPSGSGVSLAPTLDAVAASFATWQAGSDRGIRFQDAGTTSSGSNGRDDQNTVSWTPFATSPETFARSVITFDAVSGEIFDVDIELNSNFEWAVLPAGQNDPGDSRVDIQAVVTHEAGHLLGLDHENRFGSAVVMYFSDTSGNTTHRTLTSDDREGVLTIYPGGSGGGDDGGGNGDGDGGGCRVGPAREGDSIAACVAALLLLALRFSLPARRRRRSLAARANAPRHSRGA